MEYVNKLVKKLDRDSVENLLMFDDSVTFKGIYCSEWTGKEIKEFTLYRLDLIKIIAIKIDSSYY